MLCFQFLFCLILDMNIDYGAFWVKACVNYLLQW